MGVEINWVRSGKGVPFIFQHGLGANLDQPQKMLATLNGVELISMDCPGHGASPLPETINPSFDFYAEQLLALMDQLKIEEAILGGISMGSGIAVKIALTFPQRIKALVLVRPAWLDECTPENLVILLEAAKYIRQENGQHLFEKSSAYQKIKSVLPNAALSLSALFDISQRNELPTVLEKMVTDKPFTALSELDKIDKPCLIIGSDNDPLHPFEMAERIHQKIQGSQLAKVVSRYVNDTEHIKSVTQLISTFITLHEKQLARS